MTSIPTNLIKIIVPYRLMMGSWSRRGGSTLMFMLKYIDARFGCKVSIRDLGPSTLRVKWDGVEQVPWTKRWKTQKEYSHPHGWMFTHHQASLYAMPGGPIPPKVKSTTCKSRMKLSTQAHKEEKKTNMLSSIRLDDFVHINKLSSPQTFIDTLGRAASRIPKWSLRVS